MRLPTPRPRRQREPIGPLVDVVFLLLVFFLLAGILGQPQPIEVDPPESEHADPEDTGRLRILLDAEGRIGLDGKVLDAEGLAEAIRSLSGPDSPPAAQVEADGGTASGILLALLEQLRALGLQELQLVTRPKRVAAGADG